MDTTRRMLAPPHHDPVGGPSGVGRAARLVLGHPEGGLVAGHDPLGQLHLEGGIEQLDLADLLQIHVHRVGRRAPETVGVRVPVLAGRTTGGTVLLDRHGGLDRYGGSGGLRGRITHRDRGGVAVLTVQIAAGLQGHDGGGRSSPALGPLPGVLGSARVGGQVVAQPTRQVVGHGAGHRHLRGLPGVVGELDPGLHDPVDHVGDELGAELDRSEHGHHVVLSQSTPGPTHPDEGVELVGREDVENPSGGGR